MSTQMSSRDAKGCCMVVLLALCTAFILAAIFVLAFGGIEQTNEDPLSRKHLFIASMVFFGVGGCGVTVVFLMMCYFGFCSCSGSICCST